MSLAAEFVKKIGRSLVDDQFGDFQFLSSRKLLRRKSGEGFDVVVLSASAKYSPNVSLSFYVGRNFDAARKIEKATGTSPALYHIQQNSLAARAMKGLSYDGPCRWDVDTTSANESLSRELGDAIKGVAFPFYERFHEIRAAKQALVNGDTWCFSAKDHYWHTLFSIQAGMGELDDFGEWAESLDEFYRIQAHSRIQTLVQSAKGET